MKYDIRHNLTTEQRKNSHPDIDREDVVFSERYGGFDEDIVQSSTAYSTDSSLKSNKENGSLEDRINAALQMKAAGKQPAEIYSKTGLVMMANGKLQDGFGGATVWEGKGNEKLGRNVQDSSASKGRRKIETEISGNDRRGIVPALRGTGKPNRSWGNLSSSVQNRIKQLILSRASENSEVEDLRELFLNDEEMAQFFYEKFLKMPAEEFEREYATIVNRSSIADIVGTEAISQSNDVEQSARGKATLSDRELLEAAAARLPPSETDAIKFNTPGAY